MKLKGKCKVILRDAETGRVDHVEEHSNTITPALQKIFEHNISGTVDYRQLTPLYSKLLGGVCCWNGEVDPDDIYLPKQEDANLTAHAGQTAYSSGSDTTRGNPNASQSGAVANGYKWSWNFVQSQGNGKITDISLVHADVGDYYNQLHLGSLGFCPVDDISNYMLNAGDFVYDPSTPSATYLPKVVGISNQKKIPVGFYDDLNHIVSIEMVEDRQVESAYGGDWRQGHMNIYISKFTGTGLFIWNNLGDIEQERVIEVDLSGTWQRANLTNNGRCSYYIAYDAEIKHLYVMWGGTDNRIHWTPPLPNPPYSFVWYPVGKTLSYIDINLETGNISATKSITLTTSLNYCMRFPNEFYEPLQLSVVDGCVILPLYNYEVAGDNIINLDSVEEYSEYGVRLSLRNETEKDYIDGIFNTSTGNAFGVTGQIYLGNERAMYPTGYTEKRAVKEQIMFGDSWFYCDSIARDQSVFGVPWRSHRTYTASSDDSLIQFTTCVRQGDDTAQKLRGALLNKMYNASVFHLADGGISKSSSQTLTIEYTITQEQEGDES